MLLLASARAWPATSATTCDQQPNATIRINLTVDQVREARGSLNITVYPDDAAHFLDGAYKLGRISVPAVMPTTTVCIALASGGGYAVALYHDENDNRHLDRNWIGFPTEGYGFSNNPHLALGPPTLGQVRLMAKSGDNDLVVHLHY
jgi:uncharacterized protein (DUF2141 family)